MDTKLMKGVKHEQTTQIFIIYGVFHLSFNDVDFM